MRELSLDEISDVRENLDKSVCLFGNDELVILFKPERVEVDKLKNMSYKEIPFKKAYRMFCCMERKRTVRELIGFYKQRMGF